MLSSLHLNNMPIAMLDPLDLVCPWLRLNPYTYIQILAAFNIPFLTVTTMTGTAKLRERIEMALLV